MLSTWIKLNQRMDKLLRNTFIQTRSEKLKEHYFLFGDTLMYEKTRKEGWDMGRIRL
jgi:hypothetical protein